MQRQNPSSLIRFSIALCLSLLVVMLGGLLKPEAAVQTASVGAKADFGTGSNPVSATASTAAQFSQQGPKLVGTGTVGSLCKAIPCPFPAMATRPSSEGYATTIALGPRVPGRGA